MSLARSFFVFFNFFDLWCFGGGGGVLCFRVLLFF